MFHIFTLAIPLLIYRMYSACCASEVESSLDEIDLNAYSPVSKDEALAFARAELAKHPDLEPMKFGGCGEFFQPENNEINLLVSLYSRAFPKYSEVIDGKDRPWNRKDVVNAADKCFKIAYAISVLTLEDLPAFTARHNRSNAKALTTQDSYLYRAFFSCTNMYHDMRGFITYKGGDWEFPEAVSEETSQRFYTEGTIQNAWRGLYNDYCDQVREAVSEEDLQKADQRFVHWTRKDEDPTTFYHTPDTSLLKV